MTTDKRAAAIAELHYVHGYGFALGQRNLDLEGDGEINESKRLLLDTFNGMRARLAALEADDGRALRDTALSITGAIGGTRREDWDDTVPVPTGKLFRLRDLLAASEQPAPLCSECGDPMPVPLAHCCEKPEQPAPETAASVPIREGALQGAPTRGPVLTDRAEIDALKKRAFDAAQPEPAAPYADDDGYRSLDHAMQILRGCVAPYSGEQAQEVAKVLKQWQEKWKAAVDLIRPDPIAHADDEARIAVKLCEKAEGGTCGPEDALREAMELCNSLAAGKAKAEAELAKQTQRENEGVRIFDGIVADLRAKLAKAEKAHEQDQEIACADEASYLKQIAALQKQTRCPECGCASPEDAEAAECGCEAPVCMVPASSTLAREFVKALAERDAALAAKDGAYRERDKLVAALSKVFPAWLARHPDDEAWDDDWRWIVFVQLPTGQASWHIHDSEREWFDHLVVGENSWDGHTTDEKYRRLAMLSKDAAIAAQNARAEELLRRLREGALETATLIEGVGGDFARGSEDAWRAAVGRIDALRTEKPAAEPVPDAADAMIPPFEGDPKDCAFKPAGREGDEVQAAFENAANEMAEADHHDMAALLRLLAKRALGEVRL